MLKIVNMIPNAWSDEENQCRFPLRFDPGFPLRTDPA
jgi:hypothetical protein